MRLLVTVRVKRVRTGSSADAFTPQSSVCVRSGFELETLRVFLFSSKPRRAPLTPLCHSSLPNYTGSRQYSALVAGSAKGPGALAKALGPDCSAVVSAL